MDFALLASIIPDMFDLGWMCFLERILRSGIKIDQCHFREDLQSFRVLDNAISRQAADQGIGNGIRHGRHQPHTKCHEPEGSARDQEHAPFEAAQARIAQHQIAICGDVGATDLEDSAVAIGIGQRGNR